MAFISVKNISGSELILNTDKIVKIVHADTDDNIRMRIEMSDNSYIVLDNKEFNLFIGKLDCK